jgi:CRP-like cAMP-binding protein
VSKKVQNVLGSVPLFAHLPPKHLRRLADAMQEVRYMEGASVVKEGEPGDSFYILVEGQAKVVHKNGRVMNRLLPGHSFGEISLLDGGERTASVVGETPLVLLELKRSAFHRMLLEEPGIAAKMLAHLASMLRRLDVASRG